MTITAANNQIPKSPNNTNSGKCSFISTRWTTGHITYIHCLSTHFTTKTNKNISNSALFHQNQKPRCCTHNGHQQRFFSIKYNKVQPRRYLLQIITAKWWCLHQTEMVLHYCIRCSLCIMKQTSLFTNTNNNKIYKAHTLDVVCA